MPVCKKFVYIYTRIAYERKWVICPIFRNIYSFNSSLYLKLINTNVTCLNNKLFSKFLVLQARLYYHLDFGMENTGV